MPSNSLSLLSLEIHVEIWQVVIGYTCVVIFIATAILTLLAISGVHALADKKYRDYLFKVLVLEIVAIAMLVFSDIARITPPSSISIYPVESAALGCDTGRPEAFCNIGDIAVSGGGQCGFCGGVGRFEATFPIAKDIGGINRSGWSIQCDENGDNRYDGGKAIVYCQKIGP